MRWRGQRQYARGPIASLQVKEPGQDTLQDFRVVQAPDLLDGPTIGERPCGQVFRAGDFTVLAGVWP